MKVLILGFTKLKYMPYMNFYLEQIDNGSNEIHILYWDRDTEPDAERKQNICYYAYKKYMNDTIPLAKKIRPILEYGQFARRTIQTLNPDFLIVLHSTTAFTIKGLLSGKYKNKYIFDFRDLTYEKFGFYKKAVKTIVENSCVTFTSSDGFRFALPESDKVITSHNIMNDALVLHNSISKKFSKDGKIRMAFWGLLRGYEINRQLISKLCEDGRFAVDYYGRAQGKMLELMNEMTARYGSFQFHGIYNPGDTFCFAENTDILINIYKNGGTMKHAMANKYYDGIVYKIPQLCSENTFMGERCENRGVGLACNPYDEDFAEKVVDYYNSLDFDVFDSNCTKELMLVLDQVRIGKNIIKKIVSA